MTFHDFQFDSKLQEGLDAINFTTPTPVQEQAIPPILEGKDIIAAAQTGTGKTAAFLLPVINRIIQEAAEHQSIKALIVVPTRELAIQIDQQMEGLSYFTSVNSIAVYGGSDGAAFAREKQALTQGADMVIGTPGRLMAHLKMNYVKLNHLKFLVLDEADRMLDMGFSQDLMNIISYLPAKRQNLMFSATMPPKIRELTKKILQDPLEISIAISKPAERVKQGAFILYDYQKLQVAVGLLRTQDLKSVIVFCSTKQNTKNLTQELKRAGLNAEEIHSDLEQKEREHVLNEFRNRKISILVATDILSRGIDIEDIEMVLNFDVPRDAEDYIHRIGRTARAASKGTAYTLVGEKEQGKFYQIEQLMEMTVPKGKFPPNFGETPEYNPKKNRGGDERRGGFRKKKN
ncbi:MAG: DEAD/DEAH box helicase [Cytophagales bacterium]|nr:DEAD/DEAH box helicase [Cytophagales bacterium]